MADTTIDSLQIEIEAPSTEAANSITNLATTLGKLKGATKGLGLNSVTNQIKNLNTALGSVDGANADKLNKLADGMKTLASCGNVKISSTIATQITNIGTAVKGLDNTNFSALSSLATALTPLSSIGKTNLSGFMTPLEKLPQVMTALNGIDFTGAGSKITQLVAALAPLSQMGKNNLTSFITQLSKIPKLMQDLGNVDMGTLTSQIQQLANAFAPLATQMQSISAGFASFPNRIQRMIQTTNNLSRTNNTAATSYINLWAKARMAMNAVRTIGRTIASWITESNTYIEDLNLFTASMGEYANEAQKYAEQVGEIMGIDPGEFMRNQGIFMTITEGFGVASDRAYTMSKNLTQLGYDLSSFFNISFSDSMQKLTSGISGELEPLRRLGYDLSQARLQAIALSLGIEKSFNSMTQAEKAQLRYYAIMTQVTVAQGDMARTLTAPANQIRILKSQVTQCARALGNIFIPVVNAVIPYLIAFAKVLRSVINLIGKFVGFTLPEVDYSSISSGSSAIDDLTDSENDATSAAKKLKNALTGIDELNIISPVDSSDSGSGVGVGGSDLGFELPEYDFLDNAINKQVEDLVNKFKEWAGLTDDIDTWAEFFHTKLGRILTLVGEIAAGFLAWKFAKAFLNGLAWLQNLKNLGLSTPLTLAAGIVLTITGLTIEWTGLKSIIQDGIDKLNLSETVGGAIMATIGGSFIGKAASGLLAKAGITSAAVEGGMGTALAGALFGGGIAAVVAGLPAFAVGIYSAIKEGLNFLNGFLVEFGATLTGAGAGAIGAALGAWGGPVGIAVGALIGVVVGALVDFGIYLAQNWDDVKAWIKNVGGSIKTFFTKTLPGFFTGLPKKIKKKWEEVLQPIKDFGWKNFGYDCGNKVGEFVKKICESMKKFFTETLPEVWEKVKESFKTFFTETLPKFFTETIPKFFATVKKSFVTFFTKTLPEELGKIGKWFVDVGTAIWDGIKEGWDTAVKAVKDFVTGFIDGFKEALGIHSPSTVARDEIGKFFGEGFLEGILLPFKKIGDWVMINIVTPIQNVVNNNPIKQGVTLIKSAWNSVKEWIGNIPTLDQAIKLAKSAWSSVKDWIGNIPVLSQAISLVKHVWSTVKAWIGNIPVLNQAIALAKSAWSTVKGWIGNIPTLDQAIALAKSSWSTVKGWIGNIPVLNQAIGLAKSAWSTVSGWVSNYMGGAVNKGIGLVTSGWSTVAGWVGNKIGGAVSVTVNLLQGWAGTIKKWLGFEGGGVITNKGVQFCANGGVFDRIHMYAGGTSNAPNHGSLFVAGENGAEMVGHIKGRTEVMNRFQLADVMFNAMLGGMSPFADGLIHQMATCANAVIRSVLVSADLVSTNFATQTSYDPTNTLVQAVYEDSQRNYNSAYSENAFETAMDSALDRYYQNHISRMADDIRRQADKEEQTIVQVGNRTVTDAVTTQRKANGYVFAT